MKLKWQRQKQCLRFNGHTEKVVDMSQTLRFIFKQPLKQLLTGRKGGEDGNTKI